MTTTDPRVSRVTESYPGETLALVRQMAADVAALRAELDKWRPLLEGFQQAGAWGARRAARRGQ